jgi:hypothetical protein
MSTRRTTLAVALSWGCVVAVGGYAVVRAMQHALFTEPNPATLVWSAHSGFFWRIWTVAYAGGMATFAVLVLPGDGTKAARALPRAVVVAATLLALQALFLP